MEEKKECFLKEESPLINVKGMREMENHSFYVVMLSKHYSNNYCRQDSLMDAKIST